MRLMYQCNFCEFCYKKIVMIKKHRRKHQPLDPTSDETFSYQCSFCPSRQSSYEKIWSPNCTKRVTILVLNIPAHYVIIRQDGHPTYAGIKKPSMPLLILRRMPLFKQLFPYKEPFGSSKMNCTVCIQTFDALL